MSSWKFDSSIASIFVDHARQHIPNYELVINKSVDVCKQLLTADSKIVDIGSATGQTLTRLHQAGFKNLIGVDSSADMIAHADDNIATYICSEHFPTGSYDAVICNWTLHFIKNKVEYLTEIYNSLTDTGFLVLSDKTNLDPLPLKFYHQYKLDRGVSQQEVDAKAASVKDIMFINDPQWYMDTLKQVGFSKVYIVDASWCFTSFLCIK